MYHSCTENHLSRILFFVIISQTPFQTDKQTNAKELSPQKSGYGFDIERGFYYPGSRGPFSKYLKLQDEITVPTVCKSVGFYVFMIHPRISPKTCKIVVWIQKSGFSFLHRVYSVSKLKTPH